MMQPLSYPVTAASAVLDTSPSYLLATQPDVREEYASPLLRKMCYFCPAPCRRLPFIVIDEATMKKIEQFNEKRRSSRPGGLKEYPR